MEITLKIPDELAAQAQARGVPVDAYVEAILARQIASEAGGARQERTPEAIRSWLDSMAQLSDQIPPLPATISREWIYQDHD
ncbi:MAG TPA: hypothetical protein VL523_10945 [Terriglobia bacterium]|nr:hypothetical protein [Terriglobia bacterium]